MSDLDKGRLVAEKLGLRHYPLTGAYDEREIHKLLADAVEVFGQDNDLSAWGTQRRVGTFQTHSAYILGIEPLAQEDEATRLLREMSEELRTFLNVSLKNHFPDARECLAKADAHLARKGQT